MMASVSPNIFGNNFKSRDLIRTLLQLFVVSEEPFCSHGVLLCKIAHSHSRGQTFYTDHIWSQVWKASLMTPTTLISCGSRCVIVYTWLECGVDRSHHIPCWGLPNRVLGNMIRDEASLSCHSLSIWKVVFSFYYCLLSRPLKISFSRRTKENMDSGIQ